MPRVAPAYIVALDGHDIGASVRGTRLAQGALANPKKPVSLHPWPGTQRAKFCTTRRFFPTMRKLSPHSFTLAAALGLMLAPSLASAQECDADGTCPDGFVCKTGMTEACPAIACAPDSDCEQPACTPEEYSYCEPAECDPEAAENPCGEGMVCYTREAEEVCSTSDVACAPEQDCTAVEPTTDCETIPAESRCVFKFMLPCTEAADCGEGFECAHQEYGVCEGGSSSGGAGDSAGSAGGAESGGSADIVPVPPEMQSGSAESEVDGGAPAMDPEPTMDGCRVEVSEEMYCKLIEVNCDVDADCADGWTCVEVGGSSAGCATTDPGSAPNPAPSMMPGSGGASSDGDAKAAPMEATAGAGGESSGDAPDMMGCEPQPVEVIKQCMPPGYEYVSSYYASDAGGSLGLPPSAGGLGSSESSADPSVPQADSNGNGSDVSANSAGGDSEASSSGCSFGGTPSSPLGFAGLLLGLAALVARRKY